MHKRSYFTPNVSLERDAVFMYNKIRTIKGEKDMITREQEKFIKNYVNPEYFYVDKIINYLNIHEKVGSEIFDLALKSQNKYNVRLVDDNCGFATIDTQTFIRRIPFYFYVADRDDGQTGNLLSFFCSIDFRENDINDIESIYVILEKLFYYYKIKLSDIMGYIVKVSGTYGRNDLFYKWVNYVEMCFEKHIDNMCPNNFLYEYNLMLSKNGKLPIIYKPGLVGFNENFIRVNNEIIIGGEFVCDYNNNLVLEWTALWIENASYIKVDNVTSYSGLVSLDKEIHIGLTPTTKIYMPDIYNDDNDIEHVWYPIYFGPQVMEFDRSVLKKFRKNKGLKQQDVADAVGVQLRTYQKWEKGDSIPDGYNLIRLMNYLNIETVQDFVLCDPIIDENYTKFRNRKKYN